jgi:hypothetical protein
VRLTNGPSIAAWPFPFISAPIDICIAATFSAVMRLYSVAEQAPLAISRVRRRIVSHDVAVRLAIVIAIERGDEALRRLRMHESLKVTWRRITYSDPAMAQRQHRGRRNVLDRAH